MDYGKYRFNGKKEKENRKSSRRELKNYAHRNIGDHDFKTKVSYAQRFNRCTGEGVVNLRTGNGSYRTEETPSTLFDVMNW